MSKDGSILFNWVINWFEPENWKGCHWKKKKTLQVRTCYTSVISWFLWAKYVTAMWTEETRERIPYNLWVWFQWNPCGASTGKVWSPATMKQFQCGGSTHGTPCWLKHWFPGRESERLLLGYNTAAAAAKSLQSCLTLCDPIEGSPPGSPIPGMLQARTLEWVPISFSNAWKWKVKVKSLSRFWLFATPWTAAHQAPPSMGLSRQEYWSGLPFSNKAC